MTIICWDGKTLAADKRRMHGGTISTGKKIYAFKKYTGEVELMGVAGDASDARELLTWYLDGGSRQTFPHRCRESVEGAFLLVVSREGGQTVVKQFSSGPQPCVFEQEQVALGCADCAAYVAMACGKTAIETVELVSRFNNGVGNGCDALTFESEAQPWTKSQS